MRFHNPGRLDIQSDDVAPVIFHTYGWSNFWIKCSEHFPELCGKVKLLLGLLAFPTTYFPDEGFYQMLYRNRPDMNKIGESPYDLKTDQLATCFEKACR